MKSFKVLIHGGAGVISPKSLDASSYVEALKNIISSLHEYVSHTDCSALDVVEYGVKLLEDEILFNAGRGSVYAANGKHELEASIMNGKDLKCGAVSLATKIRNPVSLARLIMQTTPHNYVIGDEAEKIARKNGLEFVENSFFDSEKRWQQFETARAQSAIALDHNVTEEKFLTDLPQLQHKDKTGTVGCVCVLDGNVAAATSTGGMTNKLSGRIGDSPIIGAGTYADNETCAVSCTGVGEEFMRFVAAYDIAARMRYGKVSLSEAVKGTVFERLPHDTGGVIAVDAEGNISMEFNTPGMFRGMCSNDGTAHVGIWQETIPFSL